MCVCVCVRVRVRVCVCERVCACASPEAEAAVLEQVSALKRGQLAGAGLDVLRQEPFRADHPLFALPPTIPVHVSPHSSPSTADTSVAMSMRTCQNALDVIDLVRDCVGYLR